MRAKRNGASAVAFDRVIFVFGGNNALQGSLDTIERYAVEYDKWSMPRIRLKEPIHDSIAFNIGGARVLIFGGTVTDKPNTRFDVYDLTTECLGPDETQMNVGKIYLPPVYDPVQGMLHAFLGYGDNELQHQQLKIQTLMCTCRSVAFTDKATAIDDQGQQIDAHRQQNIFTPATGADPSGGASRGQQPGASSAGRLPPLQPQLSGSSNTRGGAPRNATQGLAPLSPMPTQDGPGTRRSSARAGSAGASSCCSGEGGTKTATPPPPLAALGARLQSRRLEESRQLREAAASATASAAKKAQAEKKAAARKAYQPLD